MQIGIDLGGTKIEAVGLEGDTVVAARRRLPTKQDYPATLDAIARLVAEIETEADAPGTVGVGMPGIVSRATGPWSRTPTPPGSTAARWAPISRVASTGPYGSRTTPTASPCPRRSTVQGRDMTRSSASSSGPAWAVGSRSEAGSTTGRTK